MGNFLDLASTFESRFPKTESESSFTGFAGMVEDFTLSLIYILQEHLFLLVFVLVFVFFLLRHIAKQRKHTRMQSYFLGLFIGFSILGVLIAIIPYLSLYWIEQNDVPVERSVHWIVPFIIYLQALSILVTVIVVLNSFVHYVFAHIRKNKQAKASNLAWSLGMITLCILFQILPGFVQSQ